VDLLENRRQVVRAHLGLGQIPGRARFRRLPSLDLGEFLRRSLNSGRCRSAGDNRSRVLSVNMAAAVLVCTCGRPSSLRALLDRLDVLRTADPPMPFRCVVVDDSIDGSAKDVVDNWGAVDRALDVSYVYLGQRNISLARNEVARNALSEDWWFLIDDDCLPPFDWMSKLVAAQAATGADILCGGVRYVPADGAPSWLAEEGFLDVNHYDEEAEPEVGSLANALIRASWWRDHPEVRFREEFGRRGGEDLVFMKDARRAGAVVRWTEQAVVEEELPAARSTLRYQLRRQLWTGNVNSIIDLESGARSRPRLLARTVLKGAHLVRDLLGVAGGRPLHFRRRLGQAVFVVGMLLALIGISIDHR
jgi:succinoglycan biosynthesis protein ExoM